MSDYTERLISMAGGDGEPDLDAIRARADAATEGPWNRLDAQIRHTQIDGWTDPEGRRKAQEQTECDIQFVMHARTDVPALLAVVRSQQARIERVRELHAQKFYDKWGRTSETPTEYGGWCNTCGRFDSAGCPTLAALTATEGA